jgi:hypothetical protein
MRDSNALALSLIAVVLDLACGATEPFATEPSGSGGLSGGNGSGGTTAALSNLSSSNMPGGTGGTAGTAWMTGGAGPASVPAGTGGAAAMSDTANCTAIPVSWQTSTVSLKAMAFGIVADGKCYTSASAAVSVHSDPGDSRYTTLELTWTEDSREMRYFLYFAADGKGWRSNEMRTYNGQRPYSDWLYYHGTFFQSPIGEAFTGNIDLTNDPTDTLRGELHLHGVTLSTTLSGT